MEAILKPLAWAYATFGLWPIILIQGVIWWAIIGFLYEPIAAFCRGILAKDAIRMQRIMEESFTAKTVEECAEILARIFWGTTGVMFFLTLFYGKPRIDVAVILGILAYFAANVWVKRQVQQRLNTFEQQMPDVLTLMANTLKSGLTLNQAIEICAREMSRPAKHEFALVLQEMKVGATPEDALQHLVERMPLQELEMLVTTVATLRQAGGNLAESFDTIAKVIKERNSVKGKIKALTAEAMFQGKMLAFLPFAFMLILFTVSRDFIMPMFIDPLGWGFIAAILLLVSAGYWMMTKITAIDV